MVANSNVPVVSIFERKAQLLIASAEIDKRSIQGPFYRVVAVVARPSYEMNKIKFFT